MLDRVEPERALLGRADVALAARLVRHVVLPAEVDVEEDDSDGAQEREERDDRADPQCPRVRAEVMRDHVRRRLPRELREVRDAPTNV